MTYFEIYALSAPVIGFLFLCCFAFILMRIDRAEPDEAKHQQSDLKQAAE